MPAAPRAPHRWEKNLATGVMWTFAIVVAIVVIALTGYGVYTNPWPSFAVAAVVLGMFLAIDVLGNWLRWALTAPPDDDWSDMIDVPPNNPEMP